MAGARRDLAGERGEVDLAKGRPDLAKEATLGGVRGAMAETMGGGGWRRSRDGERRQRGGGARPATEGRRRGDRGGVGVI